jgi:hypothetical protein
MKDNFLFAGGIKIGIEFALHLSPVNSIQMSLRAKRILVLRDGMEWSRGILNSFYRQIN